MDVSERADEMESVTFSIIIPFFNEESSIEIVFLDILRFIEEREEEFEIIVVDDGSTDSGLSVASRLQAENPGVLRIARHLYNRGYGAALRTGVAVARGDIVIYMDADGQHSAHQLSLLLQEIHSYDMVIGYRSEAYQGVWYRNLANRFYNRFASWLTKFEVKDLTSGFRAIHRDAILHFLPLYPSGFSASATATLAFLKAGYSIKYVPVDVDPRSQGQSKVKIIKDGARFFGLILRMVMLYEPLRIFFPISAILFLLGAVAFVAGILNAGRLILPNSSIFLFTAMLLVFLLGLVSSQLASGRISYKGDEVRILIDGPKEPRC